MAGIFWPNGPWPEPPPPPRRSPGPPTPNWLQAVPLARNDYKVTLARNLIAATLEELAQ